MSDTFIPSLMLDAADRDTVLPSFAYGRRKKYAKAILSVVYPPMRLNRPQNALLHLNRS